MKTRNFRSLAFLVLVMFTFSVSGQPGDHRPPPRQNATGSSVKAICLVFPVPGINVSGTFSFSEVEGGVRITALVSGLEPYSMHGVSIYEYGDCRAPDAGSVGEHFNPDRVTHGGPGSPQKHAGDLGNLEADGNGNASVDMIVPGLSLRGDYSLIGLSVVVHEKEDDFETQPDGNAGSALACGVIGIAK